VFEATFCTGAGAKTPPTLKPGGARIQPRNVSAQSILGEKSIAEEFKRNVNKVTIQDYMILYVKV
jgi:hypothetical protein